MKAKVPDDPTKTMGLYSLVQISTGAKYDLTSNIVVTDGLTNGAECIIENIDYRVQNSSRPSIIWVSFSDPAIGRKQRQENCHLYHTKNIEQHWTPILEVTRQFRINKKTQVQILRRQFPLRPAAAKTIHRCQGDTLDAAVVDFPSSTKEHMHYVGLSRVRNSSNLYIMNLNEQKIKVNENVAQEMKRLRTKANLTPAASLQNTDSSLFTVIFHNVRSLHLHINDVQSDFNIEKADVNICVETRLCSADTNDDYNLPRFHLYRNDYSQSNVRTSYGTAMYVAKTILCSQIPYRFNYNQVEITIMVTNHPIEDLHVIGIYRSKSKVTTRKLIDALKHLHDTKLANVVPTLVLGDFNINLLEETSDKKALSKYLIEQKGYTQLMTQFTTDYRTLIDHIYTNVPHLVTSSGVLESYFSDHKPIFVSLTSKILDFCTCHTIP